jgi:hypothetical protein
MGVSQTASSRIAQKYPQDYILGKIDMVEWLLENRPQLVGKNSAGYLRKAIEEDWQPPAGYQSPEERARAEEEQRRAQEARRRAEEEDRRHVQERTEELLRENYPPQSIAGTSHTTETAWSAVLERIQERALATRAAFQTWLQGTRLLWLEGDTAYIGVVNYYTAEQLERQLYGTLVGVLGQVLGREVEIEFTVQTAPEHTPEGANSS